MSYPGPVVGPRLRSVAAAGMPIERDPGVAARNRVKVAAAPPVFLMEGVPLLESPTWSSDDEDEGLLPRLRRNDSRDEGLPPRLRRNDGRDEGLLPRLRRNDGRDEGLPPRLGRNDGRDEGLPPRLRRNDSRDEGTPPRLGRNDGRDEGLPPRLRRNDSRDEGTPPRLRRNDSGDEGTPPRLGRNDGRDEGLPPRLRRNDGKDEGLPPRLRRNDGKDEGLPPRLRRNDGKDEGLLPRLGRNEGKDEGTPPRLRRSEGVPALRIFKARCRYGGSGGADRSPRRCGHADKPRPKGSERRGEPILNPFSDITQPATKSYPFDKTEDKVGSSESRSSVLPHHNLDIKHCEYDLSSIYANKVTMDPMLSLMDSIKSSPAVSPNTLRKRKIKLWIDQRS